MHKLTSRRLRIYWCLLVGAMVFAALAPDAGVQMDFLRAHCDRYWVHFLTYVAASMLPLLAWRRRTGLMLSSGIAFLSIGLEILRGLVTDRSVDRAGMIVNLLGIAAGILLSLNILTIRSRMSQVTRSPIDGSQSDAF